MWKKYFDLSFKLGENLERDEILKIYKLDVFDSDVVDQILRNLEIIYNYESMFKSGEFSD